MGHEGFPSKSLGHEVYANGVSASAEKENRAFSSSREISVEPATVTANKDLTNGNMMVGCD